MRIYYVPAAALLCPLLVGCASDSSQAQEATRRFVAALQRNDVSAMSEVTTLEARTNLKTIFDGGRSDKIPAEGFTVGTPTLTEDRAVVPVLKAGGSDQVCMVLLRREDKQWRVYAIKVETEAGFMLTMDLEHPEAVIGEAFALLGRATGQMLGAFAKGLAEGVSSNPSAGSSVPR